MSANLPKPTHSTWLAYSTRFTPTAAPQPWAATGTAAARKPFTHVTWAAGATAAAAPAAPRTGARQAPRFSLPQCLDGVTSAARTPYTPIIPTAAYTTFTTTTTTGDCGCGTDRVV